jgi:hypothetical protein
VKFTRNWGKLLLLLLLLLLWILLLLLWILLLLLLLLWILLLLLLWILLLLLWILLLLLCCACGCAGLCVHCRVGLYCLQPGVRQGLCCILSTIKGLPAAGNILHHTT